MKNLTPFLLFAVAIFYSSNLSAQIGLGAGVAAGSKVNNALGAQFKILYEFEHPWRVSADFINFFDGYDATILNDKITEINANAHYKFTEPDDRFIYGLIGLNYTKKHIPVFTSQSTSEIGWNIGFGGQFVIDESVSLYTEVKYIIGDAKQMVISVGGVYMFE